MECVCMCARVRACVPKGEQMRAYIQLTSDPHATLVVGIYTHTHAHTLFSLLPLDQLLTELIAAVTRPDDEN